MDQIRNIAPQETVTDMLWELEHFAGSPSAFWAAYVAAAAKATAARRALVLVRKAGSWRILSQWPDSGNLSSAAALQARRLAEAARVADCVLEPDPVAGGVGAVEPALAVRLDVGSDASAVEATVLVVGLLPDSTPATHEPLLRLAASIPARYGRRQPEVTAPQLGLTDTDKAARLFDTLELAIQLGEETRFVKAGVALCNALADRFDCERVALGWLEGAYVKVRAVSHIEQFDRKMAAVQQLETVMEEALDQNAELQVPLPEIASPAEAVGAVTRAHAQYARQHGLGHVVSLPLRLAGEPEAVLTLERQHDAFDADALWELRLVADAVASRLHALHDRDRWVGARCGSAIKAGLGRVWGVEHTLIKLVALAVVSLLVTLATVQWEYRVEGGFSLRSHDLTFMPAPFDGFLRAAHVDVGDPVRSGQLLAELDTRELILEQAAAEADVEHYTREAEKALAVGALGDMQVAIARQHQAAARRALVAHQLQHARLVAPMDGIVVEGDLRQTLGAPVSRGDVLLKVARTDNTYLELEIGEADVHQVGVGSTGEVAFVGQPDRRYSVRVTRIEPAATLRDGNNVFLLRAEVDAPPELWWRPGMGGTVKLDAGERSLLWIYSRRTVRFLREVFWL